MGRLSEASYAKAVATRRANQTHCKHGHAFTPENTYWFHNRKRGWQIRMCRACNARRNGAVRSSRYESTALVPAGMSAHSVRSVLAAMTTRERYGRASGNRDMTAAHAARRARMRPRRVHVAKGRVFVDAHDDYYRRQRARLRRALIAAHPDKGGAHVRFINAQKALARFVECEREWYGQLGLQPPE